MAETRAAERARRIRGVRLDLGWQLDKYRTARRWAALAHARGRILDESTREEISFHAVGVAEAMDKLDLLEDPRHG